MSELLAMMMRKQQYMNLDIVGSPTISNGIVSGFSASDYLNLQNTITLSKDSNIEIVEKINKPSDKNSNSFIGTETRFGFAIQLNNSGKMAVYVGDGNSWITSNVGTFILDNDTDYYIKIKITNGLFNVLYSVDNINYTLDTSLDISSLTAEEQYNLRLGVARNTTNYFNGQIDINQSYIKIANTKYKFQFTMPLTKVGSPTIVDGVVSGFSASDYLRLDNLNIGTKDFEIATSFISNNVVNNRFFASFGSSSVFTGFNISSSGAIRFYVYDGTNQYNVIFETYQSNTKYYIKGYRKGTEIGIKVSTNNINWTTITNAIPENANIQLENGLMYIGANTYSGSAFDGSIDINNSYIVLNGTKYIFTLP